MRKKLMYKILMLVAGVCCVAYAADDPSTIDLGPEPERAILFSWSNEQCDRLHELNHPKTMAVSLELDVLSAKVEHYGHEPGYFVKQKKSRPIYPRRVHCETVVTKLAKNVDRGVRF